MRWTSRFKGRFVVVAEIAVRPVGFAELEDNGHIDRVYASADHQGLGIGRDLMRAVFDEAMRRGISRLFVAASITARPFFERQGFAVVTRQTIVSRGVELDNYRMDRMLTS